MACCSRCHSTNLQLLYHNSRIYFVYRCLDCNKVDDIYIPEKEAPIVKYIHVT